MTKLSILMVYPASH